MVRPRAFGYNPETARTNTFQQQQPAHQAEDVAGRAREEFEQLARILASEGVTVCAVED